MKEKTGVALETDDVYMSSQFGDFVRTLVLQSRGGSVIELEYDAVSGVEGREGGHRDTKWEGHWHTYIHT